MVEVGYDPFLVNLLSSDEEEMNLDSCFGNGNAFPCGPVCKFQGKIFPTLCQCSEGGDTSGEILTNILKKMDASGVIERSEGVEPFLLVKPMHCSSS